MLVIPAEDVPLGPCSVLDYANYRVNQKWKEGMKQRKRENTAHPQRRVYYDHGETQTLVPTPFLHPVPARTSCYVAPVCTINQNMWFKWYGHSPTRIMQCTVLIVALPFQQPTHQWTLQQLSIHGSIQIHWMNFTLWLGGLGGGGNQSRSSLLLPLIIHHHPVDDCDDGPGGPAWLSITYTSSRHWARLTSWSILIQWNVCAYMCMAALFPCVKFMSFKIV